MERFHTVLRLFKTLLAPEGKSLSLARSRLEAKVNILDVIRYEQLLTDLCWREDLA